MSSKRKSTTNLTADIQTLAIAISKAGVKQVMVDYNGNTDGFCVEVFPADMDWKLPTADIVKAKQWSFQVFLDQPHEEVTNSLLIIRDRLDELMLEIPESREVA